VNVSRALVLAALVLPNAILPAIAHNEDRSARAGIRAATSEYSQNTTGVPSPPRPDTSIPEKIAPAGALDNGRYGEGIGGDRR
jgi:hypothetical protein